MDPLSENPMSQQFVTVPDTNETLLVSTLMKATYAKYHTDCQSKVGCLHFEKMFAKRSLLLHIQEDHVMLSGCSLI